MQSNDRGNLRDLAVLIMLSSLGGSTSVLVGYVSQLLSSITLFPFVTPQLLSGLHVFWLTLTGLLVDKKGSATMAGAVKGLIEASFFSHLGVFSFAVSLLEGAVVDVVLAVFKKETESRCLLRWWLVLSQQPHYSSILLSATSSVSGLRYGIFRRVLVWLSFWRLSHKTSVKHYTCRPSNGG